MCSPSWKVSDISVNTFIYTENGIMLAATVITVYISVFWKHVNGLTSDLFNITVTSTGNKLSKSQAWRKKYNIFIYIKVEILFRIFFFRTQRQTVNWEWTSGNQKEDNKHI